MIYTALDNFYLTDDQVANSPSRKNDIDEETETTMRIFGCELIQEAGILLKCPQAVMATGQVLFQRFYCRKSMREHNVRRMACACLFLATKLEESHRRTRDILMVFDRINKRRDGSKSLPLLMPETKEYEQMKERVIQAERILLKTFGFIIHAVHPHKYVNSFVHSLEGSDELQQLAWNILNDSLRTTLCVRFKGHVVAAGAIYLAARRLQIPLPEHPPWWEAFKVSTDQLVEVVQTLHNLYKQPKAHYIEVAPKQPAASGPGLIKQLTPGLEGNESPGAPDSSILQGGADPTSAQGGAQPSGVVGTSTAAGAAEMLAAAVAAAQQRLQGAGIVQGAGAAGSVAAASQRQDAEVSQQGVNGTTTCGGVQANGGGSAAGPENSAVQSKKRSRSRSQDRSRRRSRSSSRGLSRSRSQSRERSRDRSKRSRSQERQRDASRKDGGRHHRSRSAERRERTRDRRDRDRDRERDTIRERERDRDRDRDRRERGDPGRGRERDRERGKDDRYIERGPRGAGAIKDDARDRKETQPPLPPRHPERYPR